MSKVVPDAAAPRHTTIAINSHHPWQAAHSGYTVLITNPDGSFSGRGREGLWDYETRVLSEWRLRLDGRTPAYNAGGAVEADHWLAHLHLIRGGEGIEGPRLPEDAIGVELDRRIGPVMEERIRVANHSMAPLETELALELGADFADIQETAAPREQRGRTNVVWDAERVTLLFDYRVEHEGRTLHRASRVRVAASDSAPSGSEDGIRFRLALGPHQSWSATLRYGSLVDGRWRGPVDDSPARTSPGGTGRRRARGRWREERPRLEGAEPIVGPAFEQAADDLYSLRNQALEDRPDAWVVNAGLPVYTGLFGRDVLTASWQGAMVAAEFARGAIEKVAATQATEDSAWRDEEPGKLIHEMHRGPLSELGMKPTDAYYGTQTTPAMFVLALSEAWHWTGDESILHAHRDIALRTFEWAETYGDRDGDGFLEYVERSPKGLKNQAWKDSDEAIRYRDGAVVADPIATIEEQAYHFIALERMAELLVAIGERERGHGFLDRARRLRDRVDAAFWMEDEGFYAMALDPQKRQVRSIGSNTGHALATGIVPRERARRVADRLLAPDLFNGWGVRTLSSAHPSYNPYAYHLGTVWPVENATFALGMKRYGLDEHAERIIAGLFAASAFFHAFRLPEALGGHSRDDSAIPTIYPKANSPQAWSASATIQLVQIMLGLYPFAPARALAVVRPRLPEWLNALTLRGLRVGGATVSIRFERQKDGTTEFDVIERDGRLLVTEVAPPQALTPREDGLDERFKAWLLRHAPGRTAEAIRMALGRAA
ncbi:MAG: glycogen debranching N-terminal domain-containing protein [Gemmatimonadota bacterium]